MIFKTIFGNLMAQANYWFGTVLFSTVSCKLVRLLHADI